MLKNRTAFLTHIFPFIIISMFLVTKWWYVLPIDGPDKMHWGFPFAFMGEGFHTSMSYQFFMLEFFADFAFYIAVWILIYFACLKWLPNIKSHKFFTKFIWSIAMFLTIGFGWYISISNPMFHAKRGNDWTVMKTGYVFIWQNTPQPDILLYHPQKHKFKKQ